MPLSGEQGVSVEGGPLALEPIGVHLPRLVPEPGADQQSRYLLVARIAGCHHSVGALSVEHEVQERGQRL